MKILNETQDKLLVNERNKLNDLRAVLTEFNASNEDIKILGDTIKQLDELFLLVVVGEFNSGKSAFINALLGDSYLEEGVTPTTTRINILHYGETTERIVVSENEHIITLPVEWLSEISIVDTPGTNAIIRSHEEITTLFVPQSDIVLFITSADRPFTESERQFLERIRDWGKKVVVVVNKIDILQDDKELEKVNNFIRDNANRLMGISPDIFPLSSRNALLSKQGKPEFWATSRFEALENFIHDTLDESGRLRLKLLNPLGVGAHLVQKYLEVITSRLELLKDDFDMISDVDSQLDLYQEDMKRDFNFRMADIENVLFEMEQRGDGYFDETFRLARVFDLLNKDRIQREFESQVVGDTPQLIDQKVNELIDWLVDSDLRQWQSVNEHLAERRRIHKDRIVGDHGIGSFNYERDRLIDAVGREAQRVVETYDKASESKAIAENAQIAVAASAALEIGAVGLGTLVAILATTVAADVTGIILASFIAVLGLFIIPARRKIAKNELHEKISILRVQLTDTLRNQLEKEIEHSLQRINEAIAPYTRFVRAERGSLTETCDELERILNDLDRLKVEIEEL
ncbi:MAG: dynamin family protein [Anaerolineales bacterium]